MIARAALFVACLLALGGCAKEESHPPFASGTCRSLPCGAGVRYGTGGPPPDAGADASDAGP